MYNKLMAVWFLALVSIILCSCGIEQDKFYSHPVPVKGDIGTKGDKGDQGVNGTSGTEVFKLYFTDINVCHLVALGYYVKWSNNAMNIYNNSTCVGTILAPLNGGGNEVYWTTEGYLMTLEGSFPTVTARLIKFN